MNPVAIDNHHIPVPTTSLVGRDDELTRLMTLLTRPDVRLVTLMGPGGVGKTRLALQVAHDIDRDIVGPVRLVLLANVTDGADIVPAIARALRGSRLDALPADEEIFATIGDDPMLLILDNAEQIADQLTFLADLINRCPRLTVLVTSRVMLRLSAEHVVTLDPLPTASPGHGQLAPATALFVDRARLVRPDLELTDENILAIDKICQQVDGLPLAIELAAARTRFLSPVALHERLTERLAMLVGGPRDAPERHRTLRATLSWSHDLLTAEERTLFRRLGVAINGIPYDAVEPICNSAGDLGYQVPELLESLVDHSLVRIDDGPDTGPRVRLLHTVREFAEEQLDESGETDAIRRAHAMWFAGMIIDTPITTWGTGRPELRRWTLRHLPDLPTFSTVLKRLMQWGEHVMALKMTSQLISFWGEIGHNREAMEWTSKVMPYVDEVPVEDRAHFFFKAALVLHMAERIDETLEFATRSLELYEQLGVPRWIANTQNMVANLQWQIGNPEDGERYHRMAIETSAESGSIIGVAMFKAQFADRLVERERYDEAAQLLDEAQPVIERERPGAVPMIHGSRALLNLKAGRVDAAARHMRQSLDYYRTPPIRRPDLLAELLLYTSDLASRRGVGNEGAIILGAAAKLVDEIGMKSSKGFNQEEARLRAVLEAQLGADRYAEQFHRGQATPISDVVALAIDVCDRIPSEVPAAEPAQAIEDDLTPRERDVLKLLVAGKSNAAIADELFISQRTVTTHLTRLYAKLDVTSRTEAISTALRMGLVTPS